MTTPADTTPVVETELIDTESQPEPETPVTDAEAEAQFLAGVQSALPEPTAPPPATEKADDTVPPAETVQSTPTGEGDPAAHPVTPASDPPVAPTPEPPKVPKYVQVTEEELNTLKSAAAQVNDLKATVEQRFGTAFGKLGGVERRLKEMIDTTPAGQKVEITDEDLADMVAEFGPEFTGTMKKTFIKVVDKLVGTLRPSKPATPSVETTPSAPVQSQPAVDAASQPARIPPEELEARVTMNVLRPDWRTIVGAPDQETKFRKWLATQSPELQQQLAEEWNPQLLHKTISDFEEATKPAAKPTGTPPAASAQRPPADDTQRRRLQSAVQPRGVGSAPEGKTDQDEFMAGFQKVQKTWPT